ncbi:hypothetical protein CLAFUW4_12037 [Fulvia fulva]|uniref:Uncharacterized protein n=1 Tax=Passalora fulva TaxID=5499 RepID=A0A9Q8PF75_PASFU|nr:uncharacterized protein CLAFUR5_11076 [Fulvia fulva]KAK4617796.1 hypothetical protein CLAFUR4_12042 [Fulvia fulva]KAK4618411.1 hypothetical protein CLAFUR0_12053 [Fulvia fulva]UJO21360.1 hypothetical protein CLAFUR5_11076 [Fulvia fulva]WPV18651.1 hypothetical protein CLAFUW4_12037 [Fulvia fulva]WPV32778.1 hypothetical protein CLAFUW7_12044 [Fulvia fulva]
MGNIATTITKGTTDEMAPTLKRTRDNRDDLAQPPTKKPRLEEGGDNNATASAPRDPQRTGKDPVRIPHPLPPRPPQASKTAGGAKASTTTKAREEPEHESKTGPAATSDKKMRPEQPAIITATPSTAAPTFAPSDETGRDSSESTARAPAASPSPPQPRRKTGFLDLSAELRNKIYHQNMSYPDEPSTRTDKNTPTEPTILSVCKQIRAEASKMYWDKPFVFNDMGLAADFLKSITPEKRALIKDIQVVAPSPDRVAELTLRRVRRALIAWNKAYARKGLKDGVARIQMQIHEYMKDENGVDMTDHDGNRMIGDKKVIWCSARPLDLRSDDQKAKDKKAADEKAAQELAEKEEAKKKMTPQAQFDKADKEKGAAEQKKSKFDPARAEDIELFKTVRTHRNVFVNVRKTAKDLKKDEEEN